MILRRDGGQYLVAHIDAVREENRDIEIAQLRRMDLVLTIGYLPLNGLLSRAWCFLFPVDYDVAVAHGDDQFTAESDISDQNDVSLRDVKIMSYFKE